MKNLVISDICTDKFNPFGASEEELLANALDEAGLIKPETKINEVSAEEFKKLYFGKREQYKNSTKIGSLLLKNFVISPVQLERALEAQATQPSKRLGDIIVDLGYCTYEDIEKTLNSQTQIRYDINELDEFIVKINNLKERLKEFINL